MRRTRPTRLAAILSGRTWLLLTGWLLLAGLLAPATGLAQEGGGDDSFLGGAPDWLDHWLHLTARVGEVIGIGVIAVGAVFSTSRFLHRLAQQGTRTGAYEAYRADLGRAILLGLEFLVAADIIGTVAIDPTLYNLGVLAVVVAIRTFLSFSLEVEIEGRWPWQRHRGRRGSEAAEKA